MPANPNEIFPVVDTDGRVMGKASRRECHNGSKILHPVVHLQLFNSRGDLYLQKRALHKDIQPGKWDTAVGGHIDYGESVEKRGKNWVSPISNRYSFANTFSNRI